MNIYYFLIIYIWCQVTEKTTSLLGPFNHTQRTGSQFCFKMTIIKPLKKNDCG